MSHLFDTDHFKQALKGFVRVADALPAWRQGRRRVVVVRAACVHRDEIYEENAAS